MTQFSVRSVVGRKPVPTGRVSSTHTSPEIISHPDHEEYDLAHIRLLHNPPNRLNFTTGEPQNGRREESRIFDANASEYHTSVDDLPSTDQRDSTKKTSLLPLRPTKQDKFYWISPLLLLGTFVAAIISAVGHHLYYSYLDGRVVGNSSSQQWALRIGTGFAFIVKTCLTTGTGMAYVQFVWMMLRQKYLTIKSIDAVFEARTSLLSFFDWEMVSGLKTATLMALIIWLLPISALITPATLSVKSGTIIATKILPVMSSNISQSMNASTFFDDNPDTDYSYLQRFVELGDSNGYSGSSFFSVIRASSRLRRLVSATASTGEIFPIERPSPDGNMTYQTVINGPGIRCNTSDLTSDDGILAVAYQSMSGLPFNSNITVNVSSTSGEIYFDSNGTALWGEDFRLNYFAMVPMMSEDELSEFPLNFNATVGDPNYVLDFSPNYTMANQLWIAHRGDNTTTPTFTTCLLWNVSRTLNFTFSDGRQTIDVVDIQYENSIVPLAEFDYNDGVRPTVNAALAIYTWVFLLVCQQVAGRSFNVEPHVARRTPSGLTDGTIQDTVLAGSDEYLMAFRAGLVQLGSAGFAQMQQLENIQPTHQNLSSMIEDLATNFTLNMLTDDYLSTQTLADVTIARAVNKYNYEPRNLIISYSLALFISLLVALMGARAYQANGVSYSSSISTIMRTSQNPDIHDLVRASTVGAQPLPKDIARTRLRFGLVTSGRPSENQHIGFGLEGTVIPMKKNM